VICDSAFVIAVSERVSSSSIAETLAQFDANQAELTKLQRERDEYKKLYTHLREETSDSSAGFWARRPKSCRKTTRSCHWPFSA
jgi:hypothetical protein